MTIYSNAKGGTVSPISLIHRMKCRDSSVGTQPNAFLNMSCCASGETQRCKYNAYRLKNKKVEPLFQSALPHHITSAQPDKDRSSYSVSCLSYYLATKIQYFRGDFKRLLVHFGSFQDVFHTYYYIPLKKQHVHIAILKKHATFANRM